MKNGMPNFARVARAYGIEGWEVKTLKDLYYVMENKRFNKPMVIDVNVTENENCYPMVAPGRSTAHMLGLWKDY
jgi:acetolactate synthase-1/2/3 large subunit